MRELDERLGLEALISEYLNDSRQGLNTQFSLADLLRQSVYSRLAGYEDLNDAVRVSADPTFRLIGSPKRWDRGAALTSTLHWFETELLTHEENLVGLRAVNRELRAQAEMATRADRIVLDMDSSESPVHGAQEGSAYNGHFASVGYHPLFLFNDQGDCLAAALRPGNVPSADDWDDLLMPEIARQQGAGRRVAFRADAAFARPAIYEALEQRDVDYAIRMPANKTLELAVEDILFRPPGRPSCTPLVRYKSFRYQAKSWTTARRIVAKVEHHRGELFPRVGFIVTNMVLPSRSVVRFYNTRGTAEQWIKEGKQATHWTYCAPGFLGHGLRENLMSKEVAGMVQSRRVQGAGSARTEGARRATGVGADAAAAGARALAPGQRWSASRKRDVVLRLLCGESLDAVSRAVGVEIYRLEEWKARALAGLELGLKEQAGEPVAAVLDAAKRHIGALSMENELRRARARAAERRLPLATRRSR